MHTENSKFTGNPNCSSDLPHSSSERQHFSSESAEDPFTSDFFFTFTPEKAEFSSEDDELIKKLAMQTKRDWSKVASRMKTITKKRFTAEDLRNRAKIILPDIQTKIRFTTSEDWLLKDLVKKIGKKWVEISTYFKNRDAISLRNHFYAKVRYLTNRKPKTKKRNQEIESEPEMHIEDDQHQE